MENNFSRYCHLIVIKLSKYYCIRVFIAFQHMPTNTPTIIFVRHTGAAIDLFSQHKY